MLRIILDGTLSIILAAALASSIGPRRAGRILGRLLRAGHWLIQLAGQGAAQLLA